MEEWKQIEQSPNYKISNYGRFKNKRDKILKLKINAKGYYYCNISVNGKVSKVKIHRLVAKAFVSNPLNKNIVNHIDGEKLNNIFSNLEWCTTKENNIHAIEIGLNNPRENALNYWRNKNSNTK